MVASNLKYVRYLFQLFVLVLALGVIFAALGLVIFLSPWSKVVLDKIVALDLGFIIELLVFKVLGLVILGLSVLMVYSKNVVHSALYLLGSFAGVAALYISLNATFVGVAQVLVYIGAVGVLLLFAVMLTRKTIMEESHGEI